MEFFRSVGLGASTLQMALGCFCLGCRLTKPQIAVVSVAVSLQVRRLILYVRRLILYLSREPRHGIGLVTWFVLHWVVYSWEPRDLAVLLLRDEAAGDGARGICGQISDRHWPLFSLTDLRGLSRAAFNGGRGPVQESMLSFMTKGLPARTTSLYIV